MVAQRPRLGLAFWSFLVLMLGLTGLFAWLGVWQVHRLEEKEALIVSVEQRLAQPPFELPPATEWAGLDLEPYTFHPLAIEGRYRPEDTVLVFIGLSKARGRLSGPGYWVMTPFESEGGTVWVNRGFIPQASAAEFRDGQGVSTGRQRVTGLAMRAEATGAFTPAPDTTNGIEWVRDPVRLAAMAGVDGPVFPLTLDLPATGDGVLPQAGETVVDFPNNHLGYAITWFGFALLTPLLLAAWVLRHLRPKA